MKFVEAPIAGPYIIEIEPFMDERGFFSRVFCQKELSRIGFHKPIVQINHSATVQKGTIRGIHYQTPPASEIKIIRCICGSIFDVMVDIRTGSPTFMQWHGVEISKDNMRMVYIPEGFAHGFQTLADNVELIYHHSEFYSPEYERTIRFDDPSLAIDWPLPAGPISEKDQNCPLLENRFKGIEL